MNLFLILNSQEKILFLLIIKRAKRIGSIDDTINITDTTNHERPRPLYYT